MEVLEKIAFGEHAVCRRVAGRVVAEHAVSSLREDLRMGCAKLRRVPAFERSFDGPCRPASRECLGTAQGRATFGGRPSGDRGEHCQSTDSLRVL